MNDAQTRADERLGATGGRQQRQLARIQPRAGLHERLPGPHIFAALADVQGGFTA